MSTDLRAIEWKPVFCILAVYCVTWLLMLLNFNGYYWDDWTLVNQNPANVRETYRMVGAPLGGEIHVFLLSLGNQVFPYRVVTFLSYLVVYLCCYGILRKALPNRKNACLLITLIIATYPANPARIALINSGYAYSLAAFFVGFLLAVQWRRNPIARFLSLALFFISFFVQSLLVFYAVPFFVLLLLDRDAWFRGWNQHTLPLLARSIGSKIDYLLLPVLFFAIKGRFFAPELLYGDYNVIHLGSLFSSVPAAAVGVVSLIWSPFYRLWDDSSTALAYGSGALLFFAALFLIWRSRNREPAMIYLLVAGLALLFLALYPYMVVGKMPRFFDWNSRHQLLVPFGAGLTIYASIALIFSGKQRNFLILAIVVMGMMMIVNDQLDYQLDGAKQESIISQLADIGEDAMLPNHIILFQDKAKNLNALKRHYRFYELNGFMRSAFGNQSRLGVYEQDLGRVVTWRTYGKFEHYNFSEFTGSNESIAGKVTITSSVPQQFGTFDKFKVVYFKLFCPEHYKKMVNSLVSVDFESYIDRTGSGIVTH